MKAKLIHLVFLGCLLLILPVSLLATDGKSVALARKSETSVPDSLRTEVPLKIVYDGHMVTPVVDVIVNNKKIEAIFDSGSFGLRILSGKLPSNITDSITKRVSYAYGDNDRILGIRGRVELVNVQLGNLKPGKMRIMEIDSTRYGHNTLWTPTGDSTTIQSNHFRSFSAIMGVGLRVKIGSKGVANPIAQLPGNGKYIIRFPNFGGIKGKLIINPDSVDMEGFTLFKLEKGEVLLPNGDSSWLDNELSGCVIINGGSACQKTMLDSGSPDVHIYSKDFSGNKSIVWGNSVTLIIRDKADSTKKIQTNFTVSKHRENGKDFVCLDETMGLGKNVFGTRFFFDFDVLYDQINGVIGIKKKK